MIDGRICPNTKSMVTEPANIRRRYDRRSELPADRYDPLSPYSAMVAVERRLAIVRWIKEAKLAPVRDKRLLEIGCGSGTNLLEFMLVGFRPENLEGCELLEDCVSHAFQRLPPTIKITCGDAIEVDLGTKPFDIVCQSTVFTSILDGSFQEKLASRMWDLAKPGGGILWYDYIYSNPRNPDVRGVPVKRIRELFPEGSLKMWRLTLAPPFGRLVTRISPRLYTILNYFPCLRTHVLCWISKA